MTERVRNYIGSNDKSLTPIDHTNKTPRTVKCVYLPEGNLRCSENSHYLEIGNTYLLEKINDYDWFSTVELKEFPGVEFSYLSFEEID